MRGLDYMWIRIGTGGGHLWKRWWTFGFRKMRGISWLAEELLASPEGLCCMQLVRQECRYKSHVRSLLTVPFHSHTTTPAYQREILLTVLTDDVAHGDVIWQPNLLPDADEFSTTGKRQHKRYTTHARVHTRTDRQTPCYCRVSSGTNNNAIGPIMAMRRHSCHNLTTSPQPLPKPVLHTVRSIFSVLSFT